MNRTLLSGPLTRSAWPGLSADRIPQEILVVDDDPEILSYYRKIFSPSKDSEFDVLGTPEFVQGTDLTCRTFLNPLELIEDYGRKVASGERNPLCIIDMRMPVLNGLATAVRMREIDPDINIVISTAFSDVSPEEVQAKLHEGIFFVHKPFHAGEFTMLIQSLVGRWNTRMELERTQAALASQCEKLGQILEATRVATWEWHLPSGKILLNDRWAEILGYTLHELEPTDIATWNRLCHPDDSARSGEMLEKVFSGELAYYDCECRMRHKGGHWVWVWDRGKVTDWSADGTPLRMSGTHSDITEKKRSEEALVESERRFQDVIAAAHEYVWEAAPDGTFTYVSHRASEILGRPIPEILGRKLFDFVPGEERFVLPATFREKLENREVIESLRLSAVRPDGSLVHQKISGRPILGPDGELRGYLGMALDVTDEENARNEQIKDRERIETFFEVAIDLLCIVDLDGRFVRVSRAWEEMLGYLEKDLEGRGFMSFVHPEDVRSTDEAFAQLLQGLPLVGFVNRYRSSSGEWRFIEWRAKLIKEHLFAAARDVTDGKVAEAALEQALVKERQTAQVKSRLVSMASHEFRTPLATIRLAADILATCRGKMDEREIRRSLATILETVDYMAGIVTDVLDLSSMDRSARPESFVSIALGDFLREIAGEFCCLTHPGTPLTFEWDEVPVHINGVPPLLKRVVNNILDNAVKYSPEGAPVVLRLQRGDGLALIEVADRGIGIPEEDRQLLQEAFFRASNTVGIPGTGLGLAIASEALLRMGGKMEHSNREGGGSIFQIQLPLDSPAEALADDWQ